MSNADRDQLYRSAVEALGPEEAETLMSSLPPMDWTAIATKSDLRGFEERIDLRFEALEHRLTATFESALRKQTQWLFGAVVVLAVTMIVGVVATAVTVG
jgi:hypothetical protein